VSVRLPSGWRRPSLTIELILAWADAHYWCTSSWPNSRSGPVQDAPGETWWNINVVLLRGYRGLPGGDSLSRLLARERGRCGPRGKPPLRVAQILTLADAYRRRTGRWPGVDTGPVHEMPELTWRAINLALYSGYRGLPGGDSLAQLLARRRGRTSYRAKRRLRIGQVLAWARAYRARRGRWPHAASGRIAEAPDLTWMAVNAALSKGLRGLPGGASLSHLLRVHSRGRRRKTGTRAVGNVSTC
jgi:hypothetical protein